MPQDAEPRPDSSDRQTSPIVGITIGDPAGIGPEITLKALSDPGVFGSTRPLIIGDLSFLREQAGLFGLDLRLRPFEVSGSRSGEIEVIDLPTVTSAVAVGEEGSAAGRASAEYIEAGVRLWKQGIIDAIVTAPINKRSLQLAGYPFPGHTEFLAELTGTERFAMSFFAGDLRVVLLSTHLALREAMNLVRRDAVADLIRFTDRTLGSLLRRRVAIAVAGLNPHASDGGLFGSEEASEITPAIEACTSEGINVSGPYSPDTIFLRGFRGEFDAVIACYHDQATIPVKCLSFGSAVNVTLGLPLVRTSVDHGTAFDIAGSGVADESSMIKAISLAAELASSQPRLALR